MWWFHCFQTVFHFSFSLKHRGGRYGSHDESWESQLSILDRKVICYENCDLLHCAFRSSAKRNTLSKALRFSTGYMFMSLFLLSAGLRLLLAGSLLNVVTCSCVFSSDLLAKGQTIFSECPWRDSIHVVITYLSTYRCFSVQRLQHMTSLSDFSD